MNIDDIVYQYLDTRSLCVESRYCYASILLHFERFVLEHTPRGKSLSVGTLRAWLQQKHQQSPWSSIMQHTCLIARYLDWRTTIYAGTHPLATLRSKYGRALTPIVQALLEKDYEHALERLKPLPEFGSTLGLVMREHIARMCSLGYKYEIKARDLRRFDRFLQRRTDLVRAPLPALLEAWRASGRGVRHQLMVQQCGRALSQALNRKDKTVLLLSIDVGLQRRVLNEERRPYLFTETEVNQLFTAARTFPSHRVPLRPVALEAMLMLSYCMGLRVGELTCLTLNDVDLADGLLEVRETKFFKSRRLPMAPSVINVLASYLAARAAAGAPTTSGAPLWWTCLRRKHYSYSQIEKLLTGVIYRAGLKSASGRQGPRVHDLRHTFVAHRMLQWYRDGVDPQTRLPYLATYLGHKDIESTLVYLNITPELLQQASERYRHHGVDALGEYP